MLAISIYTFVLLFTGVEPASNNCDFEQSFDQAISESQAIFIGQAVEERPVSMTSKGGTSIGYIEVRFEVIRSWRLIDRKNVWVRVPAKRGDGCGFQASGRRYLVYANQLNDLLYISPLSRTMVVENAESDIEKLGDSQLVLSAGQYKSYPYTLYFFLAISLVALALLATAYYVFRRNAQYVG